MASYIGVMILAITLLIMSIVFVYRSAKIKNKYTMPKTNEKTAKQKAEVKAQKIKPYYHRKRYKWYEPKYWIEYFKETYKKRFLFQIYMYLRNDTIEQFSVSTYKKSFVRLGQSYLLDGDMGTRDAVNGRTILQYHQDIAAPVKIKFNIDELLKDVSEKSQDKNITKALNPSSLKGFIESEVIEKVLKGQELSKEMHMIKIFIIINVLVSAIVLILSLKNSGMI